MSRSSLKPLSQKVPRYRQLAYEAIRSAIINGEFKPEEPLVEERLAAMLQISRTPVREALSILEHEGLITMRGKRGLFIKAIDKARFIEDFAAYQIVAPLLMRRAAIYSVEESLRVIEEGVIRARYYADNGKLNEFIEELIIFHCRILEGCANSALITAIKPILERMGLFMRQEESLKPLLEMDMIMHQLKNILDALIERDSEGGEQLIVYHLLSLGDQLRLDRRKEADVINNIEDIGRVL